MSEISQPVISILNMLKTESEWSLTKNSDTPPRVTGIEHSGGFSLPYKTLGNNIFYVEKEYLTNEEQRALSTAIAPIVNKLIQVERNAARAADYVTVGDVDEPEPEDP